MRIDYAKASSMRENAIEEYNRYVLENEHPTEQTLFQLSVIPLVGYFLTVHSKSPSTAVREYLRDHSISYQKAMEVKMLINILE